jgi:hypothetical protein
MRVLQKILTLTVVSMMPSFAMAETVVKEETVSFEACLKIISVTSDQIGLEPLLTVDEEQSQVAEFRAPDGTVVITCDGQAKKVTVSIK